MVGAREHGNGGQTCYTSSMCAVGRLAGETRELMVLIVVDGPRSKAKFGSEVAGPTAVAILRRASGLEPYPDTEPEEDTSAVTPSAFNSRDFPWAEDNR
jgi:hypothetical protein